MDGTPAELLSDARQSGARVSRTALAAITGTRQAYDVQRAQFELSGERICGWKIGATSPSSLGLIGLREPFFAPISASSCFSSGAIVPVFARQGPMVEAEFAIKLGSDLPRRAAPYQREEVERAVQSVHASIEIVAARIEGGLKDTGPLVIADMGINAAVVIGGELPHAVWLEPERVAVSVVLNGKHMAEGRSDILVWDHILDSVAWLANRPERSIRGLERGDIVMSGTCTGVVPVAPGDQVEANFGGAGHVEVLFSDAAEN